MKKLLLILALCFGMNIVYAQTQTATFYVTPYGAGSANGSNWYNACSAATVSIHISSFVTNNPNITSIDVLFAGGDYYDVSLDFSASTNLAGITDIHLIGGYNPSSNGGIQDWHTYPTIFHADTNNPMSNTITLEYFSQSSQDTPSSIESIIITSGNYTMKGNAINLYAGNYVITNCQITEYSTINRLFMLEVGFDDIYIISSLIDNNDSRAMWGLFGDIHLINLTIADNNHTYFIDGLSQDIDASNSILWDNSNLDMNYNQTYNKVYFSHSFVESYEAYMGDDNTNQWNVDPKFSYDVDVPYTGSIYSTFYNYGDGSLLPINVTNIDSRMYEYDIDFNDRFYDYYTQDTVDVGAYQHYYNDGWGNYDDNRQLQSSRHALKKKSSAISSADIQLWSHANNIYVRGNVSEQSQLSIFTLFGSLVYSTALHEGNNTIPIYLQSGEYVAVVSSAQGEKLCSNSIICY